MKFFIDEFPKYAFQCPIYSAGMCYKADIFECKKNFTNCCEHCIVLVKPDENSERDKSFDVTDVLL